jgi:hypothetical protein
MSCPARCCNGENSETVLGCNAWNHSADCQCGWGGDGHAGGARRPGFQVSVVADGFVWRFDRKPSHESFVNPNAKCPVCGASVFFYQSPYGGRVFFDELGPPWPKHPCTDKGPTGDYNRLVNGPIIGWINPRPLGNAAPSISARGVWQPLIIEELTKLGSHDRLRLHRRDRLPGTYLYLPAGWVGDAPAMWRWSEQDPGLIEVSSFQLDPQGNLVTNIFLVPGWLHDDEEFERWLNNPTAALSPQTLNAIGFSYSFQWKLVDGPFWYIGLPNVNFAIARDHFERAAKKGYWAALNNLGVMYRDGLGVEKDVARAFALFDRAAQSLEPIPLGHLAECYRSGSGCAADAELAAFISELIEVRREEEKSAA